MLCKCGNELAETWCDDDIHQPGMYYECKNSKCGRTYFETHGNLKIVKRGKRK